MVWLASVRILTVEASDKVVILEEAMAVAVGKVVEEVALLLPPLKIRIIPIVTPTTRQARSTALMLA